MAQNFVTII